MTIRARDVLAVAVAVAVASSMPAAADATVRVSTSPALRPAFARSVTDYVVRCPKSGAVVVSVQAGGGERVAIGRHAARGGSSTQTIHRRAGGGVTLRVESSSRPGSYHVRCLPRDFPDWTIERHGAAQAQWYVIAPTGGRAQSYFPIFDANGIPVWWRSTPPSYGPWDAKLLPDGTLAWAHFFGDHFGVRAEDAYELTRLDGSRARLVRTVGNPTDLHDFQELPNGHFLAVTYRRRCCVDLSSYGGPSHARVFDGEIQELTPSGKRVWTWSTKDHIPLSWTTGDPATAGWWYQEIHFAPNRPGAARGYDLVHLNSVEPDGDGLIVSARHLDSVFRIDRVTGRVDWKLGGTFVRGKSLAVQGAPPGSLFGGQHDARMWTDGSLTVFDNGTRQDRPPIAERFAIDAAARTATVVERVANPEVTESQALGSARKLPRGDWVVAWGGSPIVTEQTESGAVVRRFEFAGGDFTYRAVPLPPGRLSASDLRHGMDRMKASPG